ncbi:MAG: histidine kinase [Actinomycetota bacterium]|nr:histidine kinase [Actinomycetota bacterium]
MRARTLLTQVLAVNALLVATTAAVAALVARRQLGTAFTTEGLLLLVLAVATAVLLNSVLLRRRLRPIDDLAHTMGKVDLVHPGTRAAGDVHAPREVRQLSAAFNRMLERLETERRDAGRAVLRAQEVERQRIAQDLHDEVNQALTGVLLRLSATMSDAPPALRDELEETRGLAQQAMEELLRLARQLRPTALDDHGLISALTSQVREFGARTGIQTSFKRHGLARPLTGEEQLVIYRVTQESLSNAAQHGQPERVDVELSFVGRTTLTVSDDGCGFQAAVAPDGEGVRGRPGGLGLSGMQERALLVGGRLNVFTRPGAGTTIQLTVGTQ